MMRHVMISAWFVGSLLNCRMAAGYLPTVDDLPTADDVAAMYRRNARLPRTLRVQWDVREGPLPGGEHYDRKFVESLQHGLESGELPVERTDSINGQIRKINERLKRSLEDRQRHCCFDYWTDFENYQIRSMEAPEGGIHSAWPLTPDFPSRLLSAADLAAEFPDVTALSFGPETDHKFRYWQAGDAPPYLARVGLSTALYSVWHVPQVLPDSSWQSVPHPCDAFFEMVENGSASRVGQAADGYSESVVIVFATDGTKSARGFIDLAAGAVPVRIEWFPWVLAEEIALFPEHCIHHSKLTASHIVSEISVDSFQCDGEQYFYPVSGREVRMSMAASPGDAISAEQPEMAAHFEKCWTVNTVEVNPLTEQDSYALRFPPDTVFVDDARGDSYVTSDLEGQLTRLADSAIFSTTNDSRYVGASAIGVLCVVVIAGSFLFVRHRKARA